MNFNKYEPSLSALVDTLIPADDYPSASEAGVVDYLKRQLEGDLIDQAPLLLTCLDCLDKEAIAAYRLQFSDLDASKRESLLQSLDSNISSLVWPISPRDFIQRLSHLAAEGYYSDPGNGGNRNQISWKMIGFKVTS